MNSHTQPSHWWCLPSLFSLGYWILKCTMTPVGSICYGRTLFTNQWKTHRKNSRSRWLLCRYSLSIWNTWMHFNSLWSLSRWVFCILGLISVWPIAEPIQFCFVRLCGCLFRLWMALFGHRLKFFLSWELFIMILPCCLCFLEVILYSSPIVPTLDALSLCLKFEGFLCRFYVGRSCIESLWYPVLIDVKITIESCGILILRWCLWHSLSGYKFLWCSSLRFLSFETKITFQMRMLWVIFFVFLC